MTTAAKKSSGPAAWADALLLSFAQAGYLRAEPAILQPAEPFLDLSGEDIRKSLYLTTDATGEELCLRPDLTIPVARDYLASHRAGQPTGFSYLGPVFRYRGGRPSEFLQAGIESFGRQDRAAADAEMLALALEATSAFGLTEVEIHTGDVALFNALIDALGLYPVWRRRLVKDFNRRINLTQDIEQLTLKTAPGRNEYEGVLAALAGSDRKAALALVTDLMSIAGAINFGGRTVAEIADRFLEQSTLKGGQLPRDALTIIKRFLAIAGEPAASAAKLRALATDAKLNITAAIDEFESRVGFMAARGIDVRNTRFSTSFGRGLDYYTGFEFELHNRANGVEPLVAGGRYDGLMTQLGSTTPIAAVGFSVWVETLTERGPIMTAPFVLAVPSKGRLQENAEAFFTHAGLALAKPRGVREYRGTIMGLDNVEIAYLSASEIASQLARGAVHLGVTGEDLVRESIASADKRVLLIDSLGFGNANVVVAVPQAWIDVRTMADLDDVASGFREQHNRRMRVATKYINLTRAFFASHGVVDYRIIESAGATEGAPAVGTAEMIVDITTTGATLAANGLKVLDDGVILRSQANLVASKDADWSSEARETARVILDHIAARARASKYREVRTRFAGCNDALLAEAHNRFGVVSPFGCPTSSDMVTLHCPPSQLYALGSFLRGHGADTVSVASLDYVLDRENPLFAKLEAFLRQ
jgi:ATP phosphoribosyltransferase regulatory subunit